MTDVADVSKPNRPAAAAARVAQKEERIRKLAEWDQLERLRRRELGLPVTDADWARAHDLNPRRISKYRDDPYYTKYVAKLKDRAQKRIAVEGSAAIAEFAPSSADGVDDVSDYSAIKAQVVALAKQGDQRALDLWLKHWGKPFLDEETAARVTDLAALSDEQLVTQMVTIINPKLVKHVLTELGWQVAEPGLEQTVSGHGDNTGEEVDGEREEHP